MHLTSSRSYLWITGRMFVPRMLRGSARTMSRRSIRSDNIFCLSNSRRRHRHVLTMVVRDCLLASTSVASKSKTRPCRHHQHSRAVLVPVVPQEVLHRFPCQRPVVRHFTLRLRCQIWLHKSVPPVSLLHPKVFHPLRSHPPLLLPRYRLYPPRCRHRGRTVGVDPLVPPLKVQGDQPRTRRQATHGRVDLALQSTRNTRPMGSILVVLMSTFKRSTATSGRVVPASSLLHPALETV
mmetsp:Transcript_25812/g.61143  ORF Transcript_25812/g.61143 Transcript_25812/m.61143 type:complete len:237 (+) Transcript_25812:495-1205(+)